MRRYLLGMVPQPDIPSLDRLIEDLRLLRAPGLLQLRRVPVDALYRAALHCGFAYAPDGESDKPAGIEALLHAAADRLGSDNLGIRPFSASTRSPNSSGATSTGGSDDLTATPPLPPDARAVRAEFGGKDLNHSMARSAQPRGRRWTG
jgi:hypothetical protein